MKCLTNYFNLLIMAFFLPGCIQDDILAQIEVPEQEVPDRPLPPEFAEFMDNIKLSVSEGRMLDCMHDFKVCMAAQQYRPFCAVNPASVLRFFGGMCELTYENCKQGGLYWRYLSDEEGACPNASMIPHAKYNFALI